MSLTPPAPGDTGGGPVGSSFLPLMFLGVVAMGIGGVLLVFAPGWLIVFGVLFASVVLQYFIWGRWLRNAILAEEEAESELGAKAASDERNGSSQ
ncbi:MAG: hypothetical protein SGJ19_26925 [Planctomycetia bacterium]|nr:hypothetical protein [Planctomycetia bacterium]